LPAVHDAQRVAVDGSPTSRLVEETMHALHEAGKLFRVVLVVQPQTCEQLPEGLQYLHERGVRQFEPSLNLWTTWTVADGERLERAIGEAADFWGAHLPECGVSWFDEHAVKLTRVPVEASARCGFGSGEIAVTPAGHLYPCERLVADDQPTNPMRLPGHVMQGEDFLSLEKPAGSSPAECQPCVLRQQCNTGVCYCSNFVRTGDVTRPDRLLCLFDQVCYRETRRVLSTLAAPCPTGA
jgi:radical SAM protein with 4Fe4S-binding SPASM domain